MAIPGSLPRPREAVSEEECLSGGAVCGLCFTRRTRDLPRLTRTQLRLFRGWWEMRPGRMYQRKERGSGQ